MTTPEQRDPAQTDPVEELRQRVKAATEVLVAADQYGSPADVELFSILVDLHDVLDVAGSESRPAVQAVARELVGAAGGA